MHKTDKRTQIYLPDEQHRAALERARRDGTSLAGVVREALAQYLRARPRDGTVVWEGDALYEAIGSISLPPVPPGMGLNDYLDETVYGQGEIDSWSSSTAPASSPRSTTGIRTIPRPSKHGATLPRRAKAR